jgi:hypothetical protein
LDWPFVAGRAQLNRAGSLAFLAPVPLRAVETLASAAVVANEDFFSHGFLITRLGHNAKQRLHNVVPGVMMTARPFAGHSSAILLSPL